MREAMPARMLCLARRSYIINRGVARAEDIFLSCGVLVFSIEDGQGKAMAEESELATLNRRVTLLEDDAKGEKLVSRHILRKVTENEVALLDLKKEVSEIRNEILTLRADLPGIIASTVSAILREELSRKKP